MPAQILISQALRRRHPGELNKAFTNPHKIPDQRRAPLGSVSVIRAGACPLWHHRLSASFADGEGLACGGFAWIASAWIAATRSVISSGTSPHTLIT